MCFECVLGVVCACCVSVSVGDLMCNHNGAVRVDVLLFVLLFVCDVCVVMCVFAVVVNVRFL